MEYKERYSDAELRRIVDQSVIYMCACPAQVARSLQQLRELYRYQSACLIDDRNNLPVHQEIARSTVQAHETLQLCLDKVVELENWDRSTLTMPEGLRVRQMENVQRGD
jgi:hypothetical protein